MAAFPSVLPRPSGYRLRPDKPNISTEMERGPRRQRRISDTSPTLIPLQWRMTQAQFQVFEAFHANELNDGNAWFTIDLYNGMGYTNYNARILDGEFTADYRGFDNWEVSATLEILSRPVLTEGSY